MSRLMSAQTGGSQPEQHGSIIIIIIIIVVIIIGLQRLLAHRTSWPEPSSPLGCNQEIQWPPPL